MTADLVLVCDPDPQTRRALRVILRQAGYEVLGAETGEEALELACRARPRATILELALPGLGGIELCRALRHRGDMAILVLSAIDDEAAKIDALESGADDYVTKPFCPGELVARLAVRLRAAPAALRFEADGLVFDLAAHRVTLDGDEIRLTPTEFVLLRVLATSTGPLTNRALAAELWGPEPSDLAPRVRTHIANLRSKLKRDLIRTEPGIGYRFMRPTVPGAAASGEGAAAPP